MTQLLFCHIRPSSFSYAIEVGSGLLQKTNELKLSLEKLGSRFVLVTDENVCMLYGMALRDALVSGGLDVSLFTIPCGEQVKSRQTKEQLENQLFANDFGRDTCILAMGGGVVTDLAGYLAATYCRGVSLVMIPTTLLAMVDASIGGKTGVNVPRGKNLLGCIYQPKKVLIDSSVLRSLPLSEVRNGVAEIIKHALIKDSSLFLYLEEHADALLSFDSVALEHVIYESCRIKKEIVEQDEKENGKRRQLNFGHTVGHALENLTDYALPHGEAVAIGMLIEARMAFLMGHLQSNSFEKILAIIKQYGLSLKLPARFSIPALIDAMTLDKKSLRGKPRFVILNDIGSVLPYYGDYCTNVDEQVIITALNWMNNDLCRH